MCYSQQIMAVIAIVMWPWLGVCVYLWSVDRGGGYMTDRQIKCQTARSTYWHRKAVLSTVLVYEIILSIL